MSDPLNPYGRPLNAKTALPEYPRNTHGIEKSLEGVLPALSGSADNLRAVLDEVETRFAEAFEVEDRRAATRARIGAINTTNTRRF